MKNVFTFLLLLFSLLCNGQSPKLFTTDKELSSSLINQIYQDPEDLKAELEQTIKRLSL